MTTAEPPQSIEAGGAAAPDAGGGTRTVALELDEAVTYALALLGNGRAAEALRILEMAAEMAPERADVLHFHGVALHQTGSSEKALALIDQSLQREPLQAGWWNNRGNVLRETGQYDPAVDSFKRAIEIDGAFAEPYNNLGILQRTRNNFDIAEACFQKAIALAPDFADAYSNYGSLLVARQRTAEGINLLLKSVTLRPENVDSKRSLAYAYGQLGEFEKARQTYLDWLRDDPGNPIAEHHLRALSGEASDRASDAYVRHVFDAFAPSFDDKLAYLNYRAPDLVNAALIDAVGDAGAGLTVADAGCGTGLCGPGLRALAGELIGVDLSPAMLERARTRGCYDALHEAELTAFLSAHGEAFDAVVSADTLCYFGSLTDALAAARASLKPGGHVVFTVEECVEAGLDVKLSHHGRYAHARGYIESGLAAAGFADVRIAHEVLRGESGLDVRGLVVVARKPAPAA